MMMMSSNLDGPNSTDSISNNNSMALASLAGSDLASFLESRILEFQPTTSSTTATGTDKVEGVSAFVQYDKSS